MLAELLILLAAIVGSAWIVGGWGWLWYRVKRLEERGRGAGEGRERLPAELASLEQALADARKDTEILAERVEFLERLLEDRDTSSARRGRLTGGRGDAID